MKTNFIKKLFPVLFLLMSLQFSGKAQNVFEVQVDNPSSASCNITKVEAFNGTLSLGVWSDISGIAPGNSQNMMYCHPQASSVTRFEVTFNCCIGVLSINVGGSNTSCSANTSIVYEVKTSSMTVCSYSGQTRFTIEEL